MRFRCLISPLFIAALVPVSHAQVSQPVTQAPAATSEDALKEAIAALQSQDKENREKARLALEKIAETDPLVASRILGEAHLRGLFAEKPDAQNAILWWKRAAAAGDILSLKLLGQLYDGQFGIPDLKNPKLAVENYAKAAELGDADAILTYASRLLNGDKSVRDEAKGIEWCKKAIAAKNNTAYFLLGAYEEATKKNLKEALSWYERGKDAGHMDCTIRVADFYMEGKGVEKDEARGFSILEKAAEARNPAACFRIAVIKLSGEKPDIAQGYALLLVAAHGGLPEAQRELARLYFSGKLAAADNQAGVTWLNRSAQSGYAQAQFNLASLCEKGIEGVLPQSLETAGQLYTAAAQQGHAEATLALSRLVEAQNPTKAWAFASLAAERNAEGAKESLERLNGKLDKAQLEQAKKELEAIKSGKPN